MKVTLKDVAARCGYSLATVSRVVNGDGNRVSPTVRRAVEAAVRHTGYRPRRKDASPDQGVVDVVLARAHATEQLVVGPDGVTHGPVVAATARTLLAPDWRLGNEFLRRMLDAIVGALVERDCRGLVHVASDLSETTALLPLDPRSLGTIIMGEAVPGLARFASQHLGRVVLADILHPGRAEQVTTDNLAGIGLAVGHLRELGHRRIGYLGGPLDNPAMVERGLAFRIHLQLAGLPVRDDWCSETSNHIADVRDAAAAILARADRPTAFVCANDHAATGLIEAARAGGLAVPGDVAVVGFDDFGFSALLAPPLTTVRTHPDEIGRHAVRLLLSKAGDTEAGAVLRVPCELVRRASTARPRGA